MGNTDSIPLVSQVKSLVQVISGDEEGALETQKNFIRTGIIASQINSAVVAAQGDHEEARRIQEEFGEESLTILEGLPLVGHAMSAGYAAGGDLEKAEQVALTATKSTVVAGSAAISLACGPGAPVCAAAIGSAAVVATNAAWDGVESLVRNETVGVIKTGFLIKNMVERNETADPGEVFDIAFEQTALAAGGAFGGFRLSKAGGVAKVGNARGVAKVGKAKGVAKVKKAGVVEVMKAPWRCLCKRSVGTEVPPSPLLLAAPPSLRQVDLTPQTVDGLLHGVLSVFVILKLVLGNSPLATPYLRELCEAVDRQEHLEECQQWLVAAMDKYGDLKSEERPKPLISSLATLVFDYDNLVAGNLVGSGLQVWLCTSVLGVQGEPLLLQDCVLRLRQGLREVQALEVTSSTDHHRNKRRAMCCASVNFRKNHFVSDTVDNLVARKGWVGRNTRILTPRQQVYQMVNDKVALGESKVAQFRGQVVREVRLEGLSMVDEVAQAGGGVIRMVREQPIVVTIGQTGQLVHLTGA